MKSPCKECGHPIEQQEWKTEEQKDYCISCGMLRHIVTALVGTCKANVAGNQRSNKHWIKKLTSLLS